MKYLNLGCGSHYSENPEWTNLDFESHSDKVIAHNLLRGIPFGDNYFDFAYHSHVLEHFAKPDGEEFIKECFRVLRPGGIFRIAIPDLERIAREYLNQLQLGMQSPNDPKIRANYDWVLLEMYDQTVRNFGGGNLAKFIYQDTIPNEDFVFERIGEEGRAIRRNFVQSKSDNVAVASAEPKYSLFTKLVRMPKNLLRRYLLRSYKIDLTAHEIGQFRLGGQIHQWMYDRYSLTNLLSDLGGGDITVRDAFTSFLPEWKSYELDGKDGVTRKPDSLFIEAVKR